MLQEVYRVLKPGGELYFSDVFADRRLPQELAQDPLLYGECLGGAMYEYDFMALARRTGFLDPRVVHSAAIEIQSPDVRRRVGAAQFKSATLRLFKLAELDDRCEDYGQLAIYRGTLPHVGPLLTLDEHHLFESNRPERVCSNTASMLSDTRFAAHVDVLGDTTVHYGPFDCSATLAASQYQPEGGSSGACC